MLHPTFLPQKQQLHSSFLRQCEKSGDQIVFVDNRQMHSFQHYQEEKVVSQACRSVFLSASICPSRAISYVGTCEVVTSSFRSTAAFVAITMYSEKSKKTVIIREKKMSRLAITHAHLCLPR